MPRKCNFNPGPAALPLEVLQKIQAELVEYKNSGMSVLEMSHRSGDFGQILQSAKKSLRTLMEIGEDYEILFLGGGASLQFAMVPMNFLGEGETADYVITGSWAKKASKEAKLFGKVNIAASSEESKFDHIPQTFSFTPGAKYVHITSNNTIFGSQWQSYPDTNGIPLFGDMSSDFLSRRVDFKKFDLIYAGAQKNIGPAGVTVVILKKSLLEKTVSRPMPTMMGYKIHAENDSLYNTPPAFSIYVVSLVLEWLQNIGGLEKIESINREKARLLYETVDAFPNFYKGTVRKEARSWMNATLRLPSEELEKKFIEEATANQFHGLKGHRSVGGIRVSMYNAITVEIIQRLCEFMKKFAQR